MAHELDLAGSLQLRGIPNDKGHHCLLRAAVGCPEINQNLRHDVLAYELVNEDQVSVCSEGHLALGFTNEEMLRCFQYDVYLSVSKVVGQTLLVAGVVIPFLQGP